HVERQSRREIVENEQEDQRHPTNEPLLRGIHSGRRRREMRLPQRAANIKKREQVERNAETGNVEQRVGLRQIVHPEEMRAAQFDRGADHAVESEEYRDLDEHRQTAAELADVVFAIQLALLLEKLLDVFL